MKVTEETRTDDLQVITTSNASTNLAAVTAAHQAFMRGDIEATMATFSPKVQWTLNGSSRFAGTLDGSAAVLAFFGELMAHTEGTFAHEPIDYLASDERAVIYTRATAQHGDRRLDIRETVVMTITDGLVTEVDVLTTDDAAAAAFWAI